MEKSDALALVKEVPTRWNSTFYMIKRILQLKPAIQKFLTMMIQSAKARDLMELLSCKLEDEDFTKLEHLVSFLDRFQEWSV